MSRRAFAAVLAPDSTATARAAFAMHPLRVRRSVLVLTATAALAGCGPVAIGVAVGSGGGGGGGTPDTTPPFAVVVDESFRSGVGAVTLGWPPASDNSGGSGLARFVIRHGASAGNLDRETIVPATPNTPVQRTTATLTGLPLCVTWFARVDAVDNAGNTTQGTVLSFRTNCGADGRFEQLASIGSLPGEPTAIARGDFDGDGQVDVYVGTSTNGGANGGVTVLRNQGDSAGRGLAKGPAAIALPGPVTSIAPADLDRDGVEDLIVTYGSVVEVLLGNGDRATGNTAGTFSSAGAGSLGAVTLLDVRVADFDRDAVPDFVFVVATSPSGAELQLRYGSANGTIGPAVTTRTFAAIEDVAVLDVDRDAIPDVVVTSASGTVLLLGSASPPLSTNPPQPISVAGRHLTTLDADRDGWTDLAMALDADPDRVRLLRNNTFGGFENRGEVAVGGAVADLLAGDFDGDRRDDVLAAVDIGTGDRVVLVPTVDDPNGGVTLGQPSDAVPGGLTTTGLGSGVVADLDRDALPDFVLLDGAGDVVRTFTGYGVVGVGDGGFGAASTVDVAGATTFALVLDDLDGDRVPDIGITSQQLGNGEFLRFSNRGSRGQGDGVFTRTELVDLSDDVPQADAAADVNADGLVDVVVASNNVTSRLDVLLATPGGQYDRKSVNVPDRPRGVAILDYDGDGRPDLALAHFTPPRLTLIRNGGNASNPFPQANVAGPVVLGGQTAFAIAAADLDDDGRPDLAVTDINLGTVSVFRNTNGTVAGFQLTAQGAIATSAAIPTAADRRPSDVVIGDFTGDGVLDLAIANGQQFISLPTEVATIAILPGQVDGTGRPTGAFGAPIETSIPRTALRRPWILAVADLDRDRILDVATISEDAADTSAAVLLGQGANGRGDGTFGAPAVFPLTSPAGARFDVALDDLDGDGIPDLVVSGSQRVDVLSGTGATLTRAP